MTTTLAALSNTSSNNYKQNDVIDEESVIDQEITYEARTDEVVADRNDKALQQSTSSTTFQIRPRRHRLFTIGLFVTLLVLVVVISVVIMEGQPTNAPNAAAAVTGGAENSGVDTNTGDQDDENSWHHGGHSHHHHHHHRHHREQERNQTNSP